MSIKIRYLGSLREFIGYSEEIMTISSALSVLQIWKLAQPNKSMPQNTLAAVNMEYVDLNFLVNDGDEIAFFPPVTGG